MPRPRKKPAASPVPNLHFVMIVSSVLLILISMIFYFFAPGEKATQYMSIISLMIGFLTGKLSNGFGQRLTATPTVDAAAADEEEITHG